MERLIIASGVGEYPQFNHSPSPAVSSQFLQISLSAELDMTSGRRALINVRASIKSDAGKNLVGV